MNPGNSLGPPFTIRCLDASDAMSYRGLRLEGLRGHPEAFGAAWEDEAARSPVWFAERLERNAVFGGWLDGLTLVGTLGLLVPDTAKLRHKGMLWGMYVRPEVRGTGLATALVARVAEQAKGVVEEVKLTVVTSNTAAVRLFTRAGFSQYGLEQRGLKVGTQYYDEALMALPLSQPD